MRNIKEIWTDIMRKTCGHPTPNEKATSLSASDYFANQLGIVADLKSPARDSYRATHEAIALFTKIAGLQTNQNLLAFIALATLQGKDVGIRRHIIDAVSFAFNDGACRPRTDHVEGLLYAAQNDRDLYVRTTALDLAIRLMKNDQTLCTDNAAQDLFAIAADEEHVNHMLTTTAVVPEPDRTILRSKALDAIYNLSDLCPPIPTEANFETLLTLACKDVIEHLVRIEGIFSGNRDTVEAAKNAQHIQNLAYRAAMRIYEIGAGLQTPENLNRLNGCPAEWEQARHAHQELRNAIRDMRPPIPEEFRRHMILMQHEC